MIDLSGQTIRGYILREQIGAGGFGAVYRADQPVIEREVAIKIILPRFASQLEFIRRFEAEAQLIARLEHFHIVTLYDYWREPDGAFLVMRYLRGGSLRQRIRSGPLDLSLIAQTVEQIGSALIVAHSHGVVHRDIKPDNILFDEDGNTYLADFGISKSLLDDRGPADPEGNLLGSPAYICPEYVQGLSVTAQGDIYSFGILLFEMFTGQVPFTDDNIGQLLLKHLSEPIPLIEEWRPELPPRFDMIIQRATQKDPAERYATMRDLVLDFRSALREAGFADGEGGVRIGGKTRTQTTKSVISEVIGATNPYKGLRPFEEADSADFFGRAALVKRLADRLAEEDPNARFLAVVGPSGSGKSSVVKAGLIPHLRKISNAAKWFMVEMTPGRDLFAEFEATLLKVAVNPLKDIRQQLEASAYGLSAVLQAILPADGELLLFIDQFEELFTQVADEAARARFLDLIMNALELPDSRLHVVITLRADFYDRPLQYHRFGALMRERTEIVLPLSPDELEQAIVLPAERVGLTLEAGLVGAIIHDVSAQAGALPLLQYALTELYERRVGNVLTLAAYHASGGVLGALARRADEIFDELSNDQQRATRQMFLRLVALGDGAEDTRRRATRAEIVSLGDRDLMEQVLDLYGKYRLLTFDNDPSTRAPTVEVAHEALIRQWKLLRLWLDNNREGIRIQRRLAQAANEWLAAGQDPSYLADGLRLTQYEAFYQTTDLALNHNERAYIDASLAKRAAEQAAEAERQAREKALETASRNRLRVLVLVMSLAAIVSLALAAVARSAQQEAQIERDNAETARRIAERNAEEAYSQALAAAVQLALRDGDSDLALALALQANRIPNPPSQAVQALASAAYTPGTVRLFSGHRSAVTALAYSADGTMAVSGSTDNDLIIWDVASGAEIARLRGHLDPVRAVAFLSDGRRVLSGSDDYSMRLWSARTGERLMEFGGHGDSVLSIAVSPNGRVVASGSADRSVILWDLESGRPINRFTGHEDAVTALAFDSTGTRLLSGSADNTLILWDVTAPDRDSARLRRFFGHDAPVQSVAIAPDGQRALSGSLDNTVIEWQLANGRIARRLAGHADAVLTVAYSPDGQQALSGSQDSTLIIWDMASGNIQARLVGHRSGVSAAAFAPDGRAILSASNDSTLRLWRLHNGAEIAALPADPDTIFDVDFGIFDRTVLAGGANNTATVWNVESGALLYTFSLHTSRVRAVDLSSDAKFAITSSDDGTVRLWNMATGAFRRVLRGHNRPVRAVRFAPDSFRAVSGGDDGSLIVWDLDTGEEWRRLGALRENTASGTLVRAHIGAVRAVDFHPNGAQVASGGVDRLVRVFDVDTNTLVLELEGHNDIILAVRFSPDGAYLASSSADGVIILWDVVERVEARRFVGHSGPVFDLAFSPDGRYLASGSGDDTLRVWDATTGEELRRYNAHRGGVQGVAFSSDGLRVLSGGGDGFIRLWRVDYSLEELMSWAEANRYVRDLTCGERLLYQVQPFCSAALTAEDVGR